MRIALAGDSPRIPTGYGGQALQLGRWLTKRGHKVASFALQHAGPPLTVGDIEIYTFADAVGHMLAIQGFRPDVVVHVRDAWTLTEEGSDRPYHLRQLCHANGAKFVSYTPVDRPNYPPFLIQAIETESDQTWVTTDWGVEVMRKHSAPMDKVRRLYPGVDPEVFHSGPKDPEALQAFGLPPDVPIFVQVATNWINWRKMQSTTLLAFKSFLERHDSEAILYIHSPASGWFRLEEVVKDAGLAGRGRVALRTGAGITSHMVGVKTGSLAGLYRSCTALVNLSASEGFDSPAAEASSCGTPVIVTDFPVHEEVLGKWSGRNERYLVPSRRILPHPIGYDWLADHEAAADLMGKALHAPRGSGGVPKELTWEHLAGEMEELCQNLTK